mgnify:CR=1 FL=1
MRLLKVLKTKKTHFLMCLFIVLLVSCKDNQADRKVIDSSEGLEEFYINNLDVSISYLDSILESSNKNTSRAYYLKSREQFKRVEPILAFADPENYKALNQPNITKIEEEDATDIKILEPFGFQVIEETIYEDDVEEEVLFKVVNKTKSRLTLIRNNIKLKFKDYHILWLIRDEIIRIALTGITGFDSPVLENSLDEAVIAYSTIEHIFNLYESHFDRNTLLDAWHEEISKTGDLLINSDFESFDRYEFIKNHTHKQLALILETKEDWNVEFPYKLAFNNDITSLFSKRTFNLTYFASEKLDSLPENKVNIGEKLFFDKALSKSNNMSCGTCHQPKLYFTDGMRISKGVTRNSPTLLYASLQKGFFYDNRAGSLEGQIVSVVKNENEFHSDLKHLEEAVGNNLQYSELFRKAYADSLNQDNIRNAIANYIRSLNPFNSKFDNNINRLENTLTTSEKSGFNLFMGKAKCATCHFPPTFNGTVPVLYKESEMELIGTPETNDTINPIIDDDLGRYYIFNTEERKHFFKTPTVRNSNKTAPYMHNGVFNTLEEVIAFYNQGGGIGLGMELENQTLPPDNLNLSANETEDLRAFLKTLDDSI